MFLKNLGVRKLEKLVSSSLFLTACQGRRNGGSLHEVQSPTKLEGWEDPFFPNSID